MTGSRVDDRGIHLAGHLDGPVDVLFGDQRVWSFTTLDQGRREGDGLLVRWPDALAVRLRGTTPVRVRGHLSGETAFEGEVCFGGSSEPLHLVDDAGHPLALDKGNHLQRTFDRMDAAARLELVRAARTVLDDLVEHAGLEAYLVYGCLLGAARDGHMIGHDSDADLAWLSRSTHPFDIIRETRRAESALRARGWTVVRMSATNFKVWVPLPTGKRAGVDVFGSFHLGPPGEERFHIMGNLSGDLPREAIVPFGTIELEGVEFPAPRDLPRFLAYTYGPGWAVPDPAFRFHHSPAVVETMSSLFRTSRSRLHHWTAFYDNHAADVPSEPSLFARWAADRIPAGARVLEVGAGLGRDAFWLTDQGFDVLGSEYAGAARSRALAHSRARRARGESFVRFPILNLESVRSVLTSGAALARLDGPTHLYGRLLLDALEPTTRPHLWRLAAMLGRRGGHTFLEFRTAASEHEPTHFPAHRRTWADPDEVVAEVEARGGRVLVREEGRGLAPLGREDPVVCRLDITWDVRAEDA
ncbi:hypothetical protein GCM10011519_12350 [Marmoricola endophyticus]|uniref:LicD family protein n=1 Tax=Marmoricola endophyticus TaxID=2040280 RepID=A0A917F1V9_9ACTN|nr:class I SAM-dependent methyltransferase [Marmoricola endophyticus]GGF40207.1 hypothetical protein GCM10011519_12350 [Marmoricola endophyticus]